MARSAWNAVCDDDVRWRCGAINERGVQRADGGVARSAFSLSRRKKSLRLSAALKEFHAIPQEHIESLINSIPRRLRAVVAAKGGWTRY
ncbi:hypothetical protein RI054_12g61920 [Pseudoscourfieldia marina]